MLMNCRKKPLTSVDKRETRDQTLGESEDGRHGSVWVRQRLRPQTVHGRTM